MYTCVKFIFRPIGKLFTSVDAFITNIQYNSLLENGDILYLQETFLAKQDLNKLNSLNDIFNETGESTRYLGMSLIKSRISGV